MTSQWDEDGRFPSAEWRAEVANSDTRLGYQEWVAEQYSAAASALAAGSDVQRNFLERALDLAVASKLSAGNRADASAIRALHAVMVAHGWSEITVDVEELSTIEAISSDDGTLVRAELDDEELREDLVEVAGNCPRPTYLYRDGEYRVTRQELEARIGA